MEFRTGESDGDAARADRRTGPLAGVRVLDLGHVVAAPTAAFQLASLGADVIRVERPGGDDSWEFGPHVDQAGVTHAQRQADRVSLPHLRRGRGKRNIVVDLKSAAGASTLKRLAAGADVVVENMRAGVLERLGIGYEALSAINPGLIWCSITGYGRVGPDAGRAALDLGIQAQSGLMARTGDTDGPPTRTGALVVDHSSAAYATLGILAALHQRASTGVGCRVDVAMIDVATALMWDEPHDQFELAGYPTRTGNHDVRGAPSNSYPAADGWIAIVTTSEVQWRRFADLIGRPDLATPPTSAQARADDRGTIDAAVSAWTRSRTRADIEARLDEIGVACGAVLSPTEAIRHPRIAERGLMERLGVKNDSDRTSEYVAARLPVMFDGAYTSTQPAEVLDGSAERAEWAPMETDRFTKTWGNGT